MKKCLFCAEEIQDEAIKCRFCGEMLSGGNKDKWYFGTSFVVIAILSAGPFALPLVWWHPKLSRTMKAALTALVIVVSVVLSVALKNSVEAILSYYHTISSMSAGTLK